MWDFYEKRKGAEFLGSIVGVVALYVLVKILWQRFGIYIKIILIVVAVLFAIVLIFGILNAISEWKKKKLSTEVNDGE